MPPSVRNLILANAATLIAALVLEWPPGMLLWPYWIQSVVIGWYARKRMLNLEHFSTEGLTSNGKPVEETVAGKRSTANFFGLHYGFFHLGYLIFLVARHSPGTHWLDLLILAGCGLSFVFSQRQTYTVQHASDLRGRPNIGKLMFMPYLRVIPMHIAIAFGNSTGLLLVFTLLKTGSDLGLDAIDRRIAQRNVERDRIA